MENLFEALGLPVRYAVDQQALRNQYLAATRQHHPDQHMQANTIEQAAHMEASTLANQAFQTLSKPIPRLEHILQLYGFLDAGMQRTNPNDLPQDFLMEMMEYNERAEALARNPEPEQIENLKQEVNELLKLHDDTIEQYMQDFDQAQAAGDEAARDQALERVLTAYLKRKYVRRIQENLAQAEGMSQ